MAITTLIPKITDAGLAAAINADATGVQLAITHVALGTGAYDSEAVGAAMSNMVARKEKKQIDGGQVSGTGAFKIMVNFGAWTGSPSTYDATELGFWAGDPDAGGVLFAIFSTTSEVIVTRNLLEYVASFVVQLTRVPPGSITIELNPDADEVIALIALHEAATNPHPQYVRKIGDESTGAQKVPTAGQHDDSSIVPNTGWVHRNGLRFPASGGLVITDSTFNLTLAQMGRWVDLSNNGGTVTLPLASTCPAGGTYTFRVPATGATVLTQVGDTILTAGGDMVTGFQLSRGDTLTIARNSANNWYVIGGGQRRSAGELGVFTGNTAPPGWVRLNGVLLSRTAYPALWAFAQSTGGIVADADWLSGGYSGRYSSGTDGSNFRIPDTRGVFLRGTDEGRGIDVGRIWGQFQDHDNRAHIHGLTDAGHTHGLNDPGHTHTAASDTQGNHTHSVNDPGHAHGGGQALDFLDHANNFGAVEDGRGAPDWRIKQIVASFTGVSIGLAGAHSHNISMAGAQTNISLSPAQTGITMQSQGSEARPKNVAWGFWVKI